MNFILFFVLGFIAISFSLPFIYFGAWYAPSTSSAVRRMIALIRPKQGELFLDLGSGDGKIVIDLAKTGVHAVGYEINPILVWISQWRVRKLHNAEIVRKNFWKENLSKFDGIIIFGVNYVMPGLEEKLQKELKPGARVLTNYFPFKTWKYYTKDDGLYLYIKS